MKRLLGLIFIAALSAACHNKVQVKAVPVPPPPIVEPIVEVAAPPMPEPEPPPPPEPEPVVVPPPVPPEALAFEEAEQAFESADYAHAVASYEKYLSLAPGGSHGDLVLWKMASIFGLSEYQSLDINRHVSILKRLMTEYPQSPYRAAAQMILSLRTENSQLRESKAVVEEKLKQVDSELKAYKQVDSDSIRRRQ